jgi:P27 family predicted phage terminase small subunit
MPGHKIPPGLKLLQHPAKRAADLAVDAKLGGLGLDWESVPDALDDAGRDVWHYLREVYEDDATRFRQGDRAVLVSYCQAVVIRDQAYRDLQAEGLQVEGRSSADRGRQVRHPGFQLWMHSTTAVRQLARELGLTPGARATHGITDDREPADDPENPFAG